MSKSAGATTVKDYLDNLPEKRRQTVEELHAFLQKKLPHLTPWFAYNMIGYGSFSYNNYKKELIDWPIVALASQKNYISLYVCAVAGNEYVVEKFKKELGKVSVGKSCIRFKKLEDLNLKALENVITIAAKTPGFGKKITTTKKG